MTRTPALRGGVLVAAALVMSLLATVSVARANPAGRAARAHVVLTAKNAQLQKTVLVTRTGLTLYSLSVERRGKFICTDSMCLSFWTPLVVKRGTIPTGVQGLATIRRPDGHIQVTYRGRPLYFFYLDGKRGDVKGEGFKDVGTWHAAVRQAA